MKLSLKERLVAYMKRHHTTWIPSGELQRIVMEKTTYTPRTTVRRLEELAEAGALEVKYVKGHAHYKYAEKQPVTNEELLAKSLAWYESQPGIEYGA